MKLKKTLNPKRAIGIIRASTDREGQQKNAPSTQARAIEGWCQDNGVELVAIFIDRVTGGAPLTERKGLIAAMNACPSLDAGFLVGAKRDRVFRGVKLGFEISAIAAKMGIQIATADGVPTEDTPGNNLFRLIIDGMGEYEKHIIGDRIRATIATRKAAGKPYGPPPFGLRAENDKLVPDPGEQFVIELIRALHTEGQTERRIVSALDSAGYRNRVGKPIAKTQVHAILRRLTENSVKP